MKITQTLCQQHLGFMFKRHWLVQGKRTVPDSGAKAVLEARGIRVVDAVEYVAKPLPKLERVNIVGLIPSEPSLDETHPYWNSSKCHIFSDSNVLLEGVAQAQILTKTLTISKLPQNIEESVSKVKISDQTDALLRNAILTSNVFDAYQEKLPKRKYEDRPAYNLPRFYGITDTRKNRLITDKIVRECERLAGKSVTSQRKIVNDALFVVPIKKDDDLIQFEINAETFLTSKKPIQTTKSSKKFDDNELPSLHPIKFTVSMPQENIYKLRDVYPIQNGTSYIHPHTIFLHFSPLDVQNLHGTPITDSQFKSRSMLKAFTVAAAKARAEFGNDVKELPRPIIVQSIQTNGKSFYFGVYQLNTLDLNGTTGTMNHWHSVEHKDLYSECLYKSGRPILGDYNNDVFKYVYAFYKNN